MLGERALVLAGDLPGVQHDRPDLLLAGADFNAAPDERRVQGVVVGVDPQGGGTRITMRLAVSGIAAGSDAIT
ncbi:MAG: hypothetical protein WKF96_20665 [Solirubrobacteraceae bacterium]